VKWELTEWILRGLVKWMKAMGPGQRVKFLMRLMDMAIRGDSPKRALRFLLELDGRLYERQGKTAVVYGKGIHVKHRLTGYHDFFVKNIHPGERILDIGCGNGILSHAMVSRVRDTVVTGMDRDRNKIDFAMRRYRHPGLKFICGDALKEIPHEIFDVITLSNVLEHLEPRVEFLKTVVGLTKPKRLIIRVPLFERDWRVPLKKELGIDYRLDRSHCIEYTAETFSGELQQAGLEATLTEFRWGELWGVAKPLPGEKHDGP